MSAAQKSKAKAKTPAISLAQELHVDTDLRRLAEACQSLGEPFHPFVKRLKTELSRVKEGEQEGIPQVPLFVSSPIPYQDAKLLFSTVLPPYQYLRHIALHHCHLQDDGVLSLVEFVLAYKPFPDRNPFKVETLELPGNDIGPRGASYLGRLIGENTTITRLVLDFNPLGSTGTRPIADALRWNGSLSELSMQYCGLDSEAAAVLASRVLKGSNVRVLSLRGNNQIGDDGVKELGRALLVASKIEELDLADTGFCGTASAMEVLCEGIEHNTCLVALDLDYNTLDASAPATLLTALRKNTTVSKVVLGERADPEIFKEILATVAANKKSTKKPKRKKSSAK